MLSAFFDSGAVAVVGLAVLALEALWLRHRSDDRGAWHRTQWFFLAGGGLLCALLAALRNWPWPWLAIALSVALAGHALDLRRRLGEASRGIRNRSS